MSKKPRYNYSNSAYPKFSQLLPEGNGSDKR